MDALRGGKTNYCLPGISVNKACCKNTAFCLCNMRRLIAAIHMMFQYSHAAAAGNTFDMIAAVWLKVDWEKRFKLQRHYLSSPSTEHVSMVNIWLCLKGYFFPSENSQTK